MFNFTHLFVPDCIHAAHPLLCLLFFLNIGCHGVSQAEIQQWFNLLSYIRCTTSPVKGLLPTISNQSQKSRSHTPTKYPPNGKNSGQAGRTLESKSKFPTDWLCELRNFSKMQLEFIHLSIPGAQCMLGTKQMVNKWAVNQ